jgi:hypothetical protein
MAVDAGWRGPLAVRARAGYAFIGEVDSGTKMSRKPSYQESTQFAYRLLSFSL